MASRYAGTMRITCTDCTESTFYQVSTLADRQRIAANQKRNPWRCKRHRNPEQLLSPTNTDRTHVLTAERSKKFPDLTGLFWRDQNAADAFSGYTYGPGFSAIADDFPEGARIVITYHVELPEETR